MTTEDRALRLTQARTMLDALQARPPTAGTATLTAFYQQVVREQARLNEAFEAGQPVTLLLKIEAVITDPSWTHDELRDNAVCWLASMIADARRANHANFPNDSAYDLDPDVTLFTEDDYIRDLVDLAELAKLDPEGT